MANKNVLIRIGKDDSIRNILNKNCDNREFITYNNVDEFIAKTEQLQLVWDRLCISGDFFGEENFKENLEKLNTFIKKESSNTTVLYVNQKGNEKDIEGFESVFRSPLFTPIILDKITVQDLVFLVTEDIVTLRQRYYVLDKPKEKKSKNSDNQDSVSVNLSELAKVPEVVDKVPEKEVIEDDWLRESLMASDSVSVSSDFQSDGSNEDSNSVDSAEDLSGAEVENEDSGIDESPQEDNWMSLGQLGGMHSDTGFLDEESLTQAGGENGFGAEENKKPDVVTPAVVVPTVTAPKTPEKKNEIIRVFTGVRGVGVTSHVVSEALEFVGEGKRCLIVDLDFQEHGVLSFIDLNKFNLMGAKGLSEKRTFEEDGVSICSEGFGSSVGRKTILEALGVLGRNYDTVLIDCPLENINLIEPLLGKVTINLCVMDNIGSLMATESLITNREAVNLGVEKLLHRSNILSFTTGMEEDNYMDVVRDFRKTVVAPYGSWLDGIR